jgi:hypothetical protein
MPIDGRARVLGMEFGVGDLLLRYDFFFILLEQTNYSYFFLNENHIAHPKTKSTWDRKRYWKHIDISLLLVNF